MLQGIPDRDLATWPTIKALPCESDVDNCPRHKQEGNETNPEMRGRFGLHTRTKEENSKKTGEHDGDRKSKVPPCFGAALLKLRYGIHLREPTLHAASKFLRIVGQSCADPGAVYIAPDQGREQRNDGHRPARDNSACLPCSLHLPIPRSPNREMGACALPRRAAGDRGALRRVADHRGGPDPRRRPGCAGVHAARIVQIDYARRTAAIQRTAARAAADY